MSDDESFALTSVDDLDTSSVSIFLVPGETWATKSLTGACLEGRKKRPQDRGGKKRKKGKPHPPELFFLNNPQIRSYGSGPKYDID